MIKRIVLGLVLTVVLLGIARRLSTRNPRDINVEEGGVRVNHTTVTEQVGPGEPVISVRIEPADGGEPGIDFGQLGRAELRERRMVDSGGGLWEVSLPDVGKGNRLHYALRIIRQDGRVMRIPAQPDRFFLIKFKGEVSPIVLIVHIAFMFGAFFFMIQSLFGSVRILQGAEGKRGTVNAARWVLILSFIGGWPLGFILNYQAFGMLWEGFPFGFDITDNKTQLMFIFWLVSLLLVRGSLFGRGEETDILGPKGLAWAVMVSFVVSLLLFLVPHSL